MTIDLNKIRQIPLFSGLASQELEKLLCVMKKREVSKGSFMVYADDSDLSMMFILDGRAKVTLASDDGKEIVVANLLPGDFFGEMAILTGEDRSANVVATADCEILVLEEGDFNKHILENSGLSIALMKELALRLRRSTEKIGDLALYDVYRRVARTLKSMAEMLSDEGVERWIIKERPTHQELAAIVGTSREMVTRALKGLEEDRCISIKDKSIEVIKLPL
jgi:CRP/FNR family transcriptional regulator, cyclic AMP receptor protein